MTGLRSQIVGAAVRDDAADLGRRLLTAAAVPTLIGVRALRIDPLEALRSE